jgi:lipopolysaccharide/colanic/teichoic acid biosynthesis glycosyltransferase
MLTLRKRELAILLLGDISLFALSLYAALVIRNAELPDQYLLSLHYVPFSFLFLVSVVIFFISGLYDNHTAFFKNRLPQTVLRAQTLNSIIAALFFFLIPAFGITPKTTLVVYLIVSSILIISWRLVFFHRLFSGKKQKALLIGEGSEVEELMQEVNNNTRYDFEFVRVLDFDAIKSADALPEKIRTLINREGISVVVADTDFQGTEVLLPMFVDLSLIDRKITFVNLSKMYENIFERIPLSSVRPDWFLRSISNERHFFYDVLKRTIDIIGALVMGGVLLIFIPFVWIIMKLEGAGQFFIPQERMGPFGRVVRVYKIRTMTSNDKGAWIGEVENRITKVGAILRKTSIDELPQVWNILKGEMSMIGFCNDIMGLATRADSEIPYYSLRYIVKPGITGWAQTHQQYAPGEINPQSIDAFKTRLAYDLYYVKHRSFLLDINIALRTIKTLLSRFGVTLRLR